MPCRRLPCLCQDWTDTLYIQVAVCECPCGKMSVQKGRNLDPKSLTHLLRGTKAWPLPHAK